MTAATATPVRPRPPVRTRTLALGVGLLWVGVLIALPLAALLALSVADGPLGFARAVTAPGALASLTTTLTLAAAVALCSAVFGTLIAWVLVRDDFAGKRFADALIDIPFALPTIVASIVMLALYGPESPVGLHLSSTRAGVFVALAFVTLPFVVRSVQPVLAELEADAEEAAELLGAGTWTTLRHVVWPAIRPAVISGTGLAFARAIGEFGSVALIGGNLPGVTQVTSQYIAQRIEVGDPTGGAAVSVTLLAIAFGVLASLRVLARGRSGRWA